MSTVLVVYGTKSGCTAGIAERVEAALAGLDVTADVKPAQDHPDPSAYDAIIVGSGVRAGMWHAPVKQWLVSNAGILRDKPVALFTACLTMATDPAKVDQVRAYTDPLVTETGIEPVDVGLFAGMNDPKAFSLPERLVMKAMKAPEGDFRDYESVDAWTRSVAERMGL